MDEPKNKRGGGVWAEVTKAGWVRVRQAEQTKLVKWRGRLSPVERQAEQTGQMERQAESNGDGNWSNGEAG